MMQCLKNVSFGLVGLQVCLLAARYVTMVEKKVGELAEGWIS